MAAQFKQRGVEADGVARALEHGALQIVVERHPGHRAPGLEGRDVAAQEVLHARVQEEAQEDAPRPRQHHHEGHQRAARTADGEVAEVPPIDLALLTRQRAQTQVRLGARARSMARDQVAEVIGTARVAAFPDHAIQAGGGQPRKLGEGLADEGQIGVDRRRTLHRPEPGQPGLGQHARNGVPMQGQLGGDGADAPALGVVVAQDLRLLFRG